MSMRVTESMMFQSATTEAQSARSRLEQATREVSSGKRVEHPGDDPTAASLVPQARINSARFGAISSAVGRASDELNVANGALGQVQQQLARGIELATQMSNGTYSAADRAGAAVEVDGLIQGIVGLLNTRVANRYIFGGTKDDVPPFDTTGTYLGDTGVRKVEVAPGVLQTSSVRADVAIKGVGGGADVLATLQTLSTALRANDPDSTRNTLPSLSQGVAQVGLATAQIGSSQNIFDAADAASRLMGDVEDKRASGLVDVDLVDAASKLTLANQALNASLSAAAKSFTMTLLDKLG